MTKSNRKTLIRNIDQSSPDFGLINNFEYSFDDFGFVDWKSLIPKQFLFPNTEKFKSLGKEIPSSIDGLDESMILIKLSGIKWLARVRGYTRVDFDYSSSGAASTAKCRIHWIPNFENPQGAVYEEVASCDSRNADDFSLKFSESIASNRAFVRCVRNFLNVNIVGEEEIFNKESSQIKNIEESSKPSQMSIDPQSIFIKICKEKNMSFDDILKFSESIIDKEIDLKSIKDEKSLISNLNPKIAKKLLKEIKKV